MKATLAGTALTAVALGSVVEVRLHRDPCNEIGTTLLAELEQLLSWLEARGPAVVVFHSDRPRGFCAGADLRELHAGLVSERAGRWGERIPARVRRRMLAPLVRRKVGAFIDRIHAVFDGLDMLPSLTIAVLHGVTFGGGLELALTADIRIAEDNARLAFPELRLGLVPGFGGIPRLERDVGNAVIRDLLLSGRSLGAKRAYQVGLVSQLVPRGKGMTAARALAAQSIRFDPKVVARAKRFVKPLPAARLSEEKQAFLEMVTDPGVFDALARFVEDEGPRPYLA